MDQLFFHRNIFPPSEVVAWRVVFFVEADLVFLFGVQGMQLPSGGTKLYFRAFEDHILDEATCTYRSIVIPSALTKCTHLEDKSSTLGLLVTTVEHVVSMFVPVKSSDCG